MRTRHSKFLLALSCSLLVIAGGAGSTASAAARPEASTKSTPEKPRVVFFPARGAVRSVGVKPRTASTALVNHGGPTITSAKVVLIFWGSSFSNPASPDYTYAQTIISYRNQFGTTPEYNTITEYSGIQLSNLAAGTADWFDSSTPPTNVTDSAVQGEVNTYLASHTFDASSIYEVFLPSSSYSSFGSSTSCGGPALAYCAYHSWIGSGASAIKYSIQPYPSCGGCQVSGWTAVQNQEHFISHETREAVTDATGSAWYDASGNEADDLCAWSPTPFFGTGGYGYQYEWSNAAGGCVTSTAIASGPAAPTLTVESNFCRGSNSASWTASTGATYYELWGSSLSTFAASALYYSGPGTSKLINVGGKTYLHVRACNASGCGAFGNTDIATYTNGCL